jgi:hypothetical protein
MESGRTPSTSSVARQNFGRKLLPSTLLRLSPNMTQPRRANDSNAWDDLAIAMTVLGLSLIIFAIRIYTRVYPKYKLDASDYTLLVAVVSRIKEVYAVTKKND